MSAPTWSPVYPAEIAADHSWGPLAGPSVMIGEMAARIFVAGLYLLLVQSVLTDFLRTGRMTALPLMISELLVVVFTLLRRRATPRPRGCPPGALPLARAWPRGGAGAWCGRGSPG